MLRTIGKQYRFVFLNTQIHEICAIIAQNERKNKMKISKRIHIIDNKVYLLVDNLGRIIFPKFLLKENFGKLIRIKKLNPKQFLCTVVKESDNNRRVSIAVITINDQKTLNIREGDPFEVTCCDEGFLLTRADREILK